MDKYLWMLRLKSFGIAAGTYLGAGLLGLLLSDEFMAIVSQHVGTSVWGSIIMLIGPEVVKYYRNKVVIGRAQAFGHIGTAHPPVDLL